MMIFILTREGCLAGSTDEYKKENGLQENLLISNWFDGATNNEGLKYALCSRGQKIGMTGDHDFQIMFLEYIPNNEEGQSGSGMAPIHITRVPEPFSGDWWANSADDVQIRACYFDDRYVFDEEGFHNDQVKRHGLMVVAAILVGLLFFRMMVRNPAGYVFDDAAGL